MKFALLNNERIEATKGAKGVCPSCGSELIAKCGEVYAHYWAHKKKCVDHWWENETEWHRNWKNEFPNEWQEIIQYDESGEKHIADVKTKTGWTIEFQHSFIESEERNSRDNFYNKLIWVVDGARRKTDIKQFQNLLNEAIFIADEPSVSKVDYPEEYRLIREWGYSKSLVLVDFGNSSIDELWLIYPLNNAIYVSSFLRNSFIELMNNAESDEVLSSFINPIQKELDDYKAKQEDRIRIAEEKAKKEDEKERKRLLRVKARTPVEKKVAYVIGVCRNRFDDFDIKVASTTLNSYVKALNKFGYSGEDIFIKFDMTVIPKTIEAKNCTEWKNLIEKFKQEIV